MRRRLKWAFIFAVFTVAFLAGIKKGLGVPLAAAFATALTTGAYLTMREDSHIRGKRLLPYTTAREELKRLCRQNNDAGFRGFGGVTLPRDAKYNNFLFQGATGTGKTITLYPLMYEALKNGTRGTRALLHDYKMVFRSFLFHIGIDERRIKILNPFDERALAWDIQRDCINTLAANEIATSLAVNDGNAENFFDGSAQLLLSSVMKFFLFESRQRPVYHWTLRDVVNGASSKDDMKEMFSRYSELQNGLTYLQNPNADVDRTIARHVFRLEPIAALWEGRERFSFSDWKEDDILIIGYDAKYKKQSPVINALLLQLAIQALEDTDITPTTPDTWFFLEEFPQIAGVPEFDTALSTVREKRGCIAAVIQSPTQIREKYKEKADNILGLFRNQAFFQSQDEAAVWASKRCGNEEIYEKSTGESFGKDGMRTSDNEAPKPKPLVMPEQIEQLKLLRHDGKIHGYYVAVDLGGSPYYHRLDREDLAHVWRENGYPTDYQRITDPQATELKAWTDEDRIRLGLTPRENAAPTETPKKKRINIELETGGK